jgi:carbon-monoxide dehydrogenase small subunit
MIGEQTVRVELNVNDSAYTLEVDPRRHLADVLREDLGLRATHLGCEHGVCGACTVLFDGEPIRSCLMLAVQADGHEVSTVEGLSADGELHPIQEAFRDHHALQCGFCTPGFLMMASYLLGEQPELADEGELRTALAGNLCRCTGYHNIVDAVKDAAGRLRGGDGQPAEREVSGHG